MKSQSPLVWSQRRVELYTVSAIDLDFTLVIFPGDSELDDTLGDRSDLESRLVFWVLLEEGGVFESRGKLYRWMELVTDDHTGDSGARPKAHLYTPARILARMEGWPWLESGLRNGASEDDNDQLANIQRIVGAVQPLKQFGCIR